MKTKTFIIMKSCLCSVIDDFFLLRKQKVKLHFLKFRPAGFCNPGFYHRFFLSEGHTEGVGLATQ